MGAKIARREYMLYGTTYTDRRFGQADLEGVSLRMKSTSRNWRNPIITLVGAKKGEKLRIDGFIASNGIELSDWLAQKYKIPLEQEK
ncbi:MAG: hypothetical protein HQM08_14075 [Candidatus Riflebacteria bacterium]|nr:hypothetical protein [Candidatus Riflebacteria bacterium]